MDLNLGFNLLRGDDSGFMRGVGFASLLGDFFVGTG